MSPDTRIIKEPRVLYHELTSRLVNRLSARDAEEVIVGLVAERARVKERGIILSFGEFNENPDPQVNRLLAKILVGQVSRKFVVGKQAKNIAVVSVENSASYLALELTHELEKQFGLDRSPRIIRARKSPTMAAPSPAMGKIRAATTVYPITAGGDARYLVASLSDPSDLQDVKLLFVVDDFRATGNTLRGGVELGRDLLLQAGVQTEGVTVIPMAGLGKPQQTQEVALSMPGIQVTDVLTAVDVHFYADHTTGQALVQVNSFPPFLMHNATASDFT